jgi:hypothetical protein
LLPEDDNNATDVGFGWCFEKPLPLIISMKNVKQQHGGCKKSILSFPLPINKNPLELDT